MLNIDYANVDACAKAVAENADLVLGVKVRITDSVVGQNGLEPLRRAIRAAEMAGKRVPGDVPHRIGARHSLRPARPAAPGRRPHPRLQRRRQQHGAERPGSCPPRWPPSSAG